MVFRAYIGLGLEVRICLFLCQTFLDQGLGLWLLNLGFGISGLGLRA